MSDLSFDLCRLAFQSLQNIMVDLPSWRNEVLLGFVQFVTREVTDPFYQLSDQCCRRIISILTQWKQTGHADIAKVRSH